MKKLNALIFIVLWGGVSAQVGIGTTTPSNDLDVESNSGTATAVDINCTGAGDPKINLQLNSTTTFSIGVDNDDADKLKIGTTAPETNTRVTIDNTGNVGVGTATPGAKLDVDGSAIFNESSNARDFRIESDANTHHFYVDGTNNEIGVNTSTPASTLDIQGSLGYKVTTITAATTLAQTHNVVLCNSGPYTVTLPVAASNTGKVYYIKNISSTNVTITLDGNASETIDGSTTYELGLYKHAVRIICDGSNWHVLENSGTKMTTSTFTTTNCDASGMAIIDVLNPTTGKIWMDRNLGASRVATNSRDASSYGDLYQWGRLKDGHQCRTSATTSTLSSTDVPGHANYITINTTPNDWRNPQNSNLWQGVNGINNPCPTGYRLPTSTEWTNEVNSWGTHPREASAFSSLLKLPVAGRRELNGGIGVNVGNYWSSSLDGSGSQCLGFSDSYGNTAYGYGYWQRAHGMSVRCIKD